MELELRVSVVICTFNGSRFLQQQLDSIARQSLLPYELIICDDCSTDSTADIARAFTNRAPFTVRLYLNEHRFGSTKNFERAISLATGDLIALCDQDDVWLDNKLEVLTKQFGEPTTSAIFTDALLIDENGLVLPGTLWSRGHLSQRELKQFYLDPAGLLLKQDVVTGATMIFRTSVRQLFQDIPSSWVHDGWMAWMIVLHSSEFGQLKACQEPLIAYRLHTAQQTGPEADRSGSRGESYRARLQKARSIGHSHHQAVARRLSLVSERWLSSGGSASEALLSRIQGAIELNFRRSNLPVSFASRTFRIMSMIPLYLRYGRGLSSAIRDMLV